MLLLDPNTPRFFVMLFSSLLMYCSHRDKATSVSDIAVRAFSHELIFCTDEKGGRIFCFENGR